LAHELQKRQRLIGLADMRKILGTIFLGLRVSGCASGLGTSPTVNNAGLTPLIICEDEPRTTPVYTDISEATDFLDCRIWDGS
jgi:hypothetical protein